MGSVFVETLGQGMPLVLVHGWGLNGAVWHSLVDEFSQDFTLHLVDLPGFGHSAPLGKASLEAMAESLLDAVPEPAVWLGWSLGGLVAMQAALQRPAQVSRLITVASSAAFIKRADWPGIEPKVLAGFARGLDEDYQKTLSRFLAIQAMGSPSAKEDIKALQRMLSSRPAPSQDALRQGLDLLKESDLRGQIGQIKQPWLQLYGYLDALVPRGAAQMHQTLHPAQQYSFRHASHAPFISHQHEFAQQIRAFMVM
jgi:pimeloyl-[acyl-carrier protein] methyl ester esterase